MTANKTPRLALMNPVDTDPFQTSDFADTFNKLDAVPGTTLVNNYNSLPTNWTTAQHGSEVLQRDNGARWMWSKPGTNAGIWKRTNSLGYLGASNPGSLSTTSTTPNSGTRTSTINVVAPGGRALLLVMQVDTVAIAQGGTAIIALEINGSIIRQVLHAFATANNAGHSIAVPYTSPTPQTTYTINTYTYTSNSGWSASATGQNVFVYEI